MRRLSWLRSVVNDENVGPEAVLVAAVAAVQDATGAQSHWPLVIIRPAVADRMGLDEDLVDRIAGDLVTDGYLRPHRTPGVRTRVYAATRPPRIARAA